MRVAIALISFSFYAILAPQDFINADAVVYAEQIREANFSERTTHLAYYLVAYPVSFLPMPLDHALNLLNCAFGAGVVLLVALLAEAVTKSRSIALMAATFAVSNGVIAYNAIHAEVYISQVFFLLLAMYFWQTRRSALAGCSAATSFLISASSALSAVYFVVVRPRLKPLLLAGTVATVLAVVALAPVAQNYLFGARGLSSAAAHDVNYPLALAKTGQDLFFGFFALLPFLAAGILSCWRFNKRFLAAVALLAAVTFAAGEKFIDVPVQLTTFALASILAAIGVSRLHPLAALICAGIVPLILLTERFTPERYADHLPGPLELTVFLASVAAVGLLRQYGVVIAVASNLFLIALQSIEIRRELSDFRELAQEIRKSNEPIIVAEWNEMVRMNWLVYGVAYHDRSYLPEAFEPDLHAGKRLWRLDPR